MRIPVRVTAIAIAAGVVAATVIAWSAADSATRSPANVGNVGAEVARSAARSARPLPSATPSVKPPVRIVGAPAGVQAKGAVLADASTGSVLWSRRLNTELPMGSITKVMTALVVIRAGDLNRKIRVPKSVIAYVSKYGGESAGLIPGDVVTAQELLEAMLLPSGCDAAYTLAMAYGPGMSAFLAKMNETAKQLGMLHTHFTSPDGLPYPTETSTYSTPADLTRLGEVAMGYQEFRSIVGLRYYNLPKGDGHSAVSVTS